MHFVHLHRIQKVLHWILTSYIISTYQVGTFQKNIFNLKSYLYLHWLFLIFFVFRHAYSNLRHCWLYYFREIHHRLCYSYLNSFPTKYWNHIIIDYMSKYMLYSRLLYVVRAINFTCGLILITALVTTTWGVELLDCWIWQSRLFSEGRIPPLTELLLLNMWFRQGGLSEPVDPSHPTPEPDESESVDAWPEDPDDPEVELFWEPPFEPLSELCVMDETPLVLPLLPPYDNFGQIPFLLK